MDERAHSIWGPQCSTHASVGSSQLTGSSTPSAWFPKEHEIRAKDMSQTSNQSAGITYLGVLKHLGEVDSLCAQHKLLFILTVGRFIQKAPSDALGCIDNGIVGQGHNQGAHVKMNLHQWELQSHL